MFPLRITDSLKSDLMAIAEGNERSLQKELTVLLKSFRDSNISDKGKPKADTKYVSD